VRATRRLRGLTVTALASRIGCSRGYLSGLESGSRRSSREPRIRALADALGLDENALKALACLERCPPVLRWEFCRQTWATWSASLLGAVPFGPAEMASLVSSGLLRAAPPAAPPAPRRADPAETRRPFVAGGVRGPARHAKGNGHGNRPGLSGGRWLQGDGPSATSGGRQPARVAGL
jgi:transcriptional regulator with XRE-family HTH domain